MAKRVQEHTDLFLKKVRITIFLMLFGLFVFNHEYNFFNFLLSFSGISLFFDFNISNFNKLKYIFFLFLINFLISPVKFLFLERFFILCGSIFTGIIVYHFFTKRDIEYLLMLFFFIFSIVGITQFLKNFDKSLSIISYFLNQNFFGAFLIIMYGFFIEKKRIFIAFLYVFLAYSTHSRGVFLYLTSAYLFSILKYRRRYLIIHLIFLWILILTDTYSLEKLNLDIYTHKFSRIDIWKTAYEIFKDSFLYGIGLGHLSSYFLEKSNFNILHVHSFYLEYLIEIGILGIAVLIFYFKKIKLFLVDNIEVLLPILLYNLTTNAFFSYKILIIFCIFIAFLLKKSKDILNISFYDYLKWMLIYLELFIIGYVIFYYFNFNLKILISIFPIVMAIFLFFPYNFKFFFKRSVCFFLTIFFLLNVFFYEISVDYYNMGLFNKAEKFLNFTTIPIAYFLKGNISYFKGNLDNAKYLYNIGLNIYPFYDLFKINDAILCNKKFDINLIKQAESFSLYAVYSNNKNLFLKSIYLDHNLIYINYFKDLKFSLLNKKNLLDEAYYYYLKGNFKMAKNLYIHYINKHFEIENRAIAIHFLKKMGVEKYKYCLTDNGYITSRIFMLSNPYNMALIDIYGIKETIL